MSMNQTFETYTDINWELQFDPLYGSPIEIPAYSILWRGYHTTYPSLSDRPSYYSSKEVASGYVVNDKTHHLGCFMTTKPLRLLDVRFMKNILSRMIHTHYNNENINDLLPIMISFGLCSLRHQIHITKLRYNDTLQRDPSLSNPIRAGITAMEKFYQPASYIEQFGIRIAETTNDGGVMTFLKEFFKDKFDGFISPRMRSVFHVEKPNGMSPEMILFSPKQAGIIQISYDTKTFIPHPYKYMIDKKFHVTITGIQKKSFRDFLSDHRHIYLPVADQTFSFYMSGGNISDTNGQKTEHPLNEYQLNSRKKKIKEFDEKCKQSGQRWRDHFQYWYHYAPHPTANVSPFPSQSIHSHLEMDNGA